MNCFRVQFSGDLVTALPDVSQIALGSDAECVILASDGLWDYISRFSGVIYTCTCHFYLSYMVICNIMKKYLKLYTISVQMQSISLGINFDNMEMFR